MILHHLEASKQAGRKLLALLVDPDKTHGQELVSLMDVAQKAGVDLVFVGGSLLTGGSQRLDDCLRLIKSNSNLPVILFPGSPLQISKEADALLFLSVISGRNPELLIGHHVISAPYLKATGLEVLPTGYMLVDGGAATTASYISNTHPMPANKPEIAACTALAGEMLGLRVMYLDAGSGAEQPVPAEMVQQVSQEISVPLIVGGGINTPEKAQRAWSHGADIVVVGNAIEKNSLLLEGLAASKLSV